MDNWMEMSLLLDFYGGLLTERQRTAAQYTYNQDLSLTEISQLMGITKQAVFENLRRANRALTEYERCLGLKERFTFLEREISAIADVLEDPDGNSAAVQSAAARLRALSSEEGEML